MSDWSIIEGFRDVVEGISNTTANSSGTRVDPAGSANTKGSWTTLVASTSRAASGIGIVVIETASAVRQRQIFDIAVGAAAAEQIILPDLQISLIRADSYPVFFRFPVSIPAGTRISARIQSTEVGGFYMLVVELYDGGFNRPETFGGVVTAYGPDLTDSSGVAITVPGSVNTKGAWIEITSSTARDHRGLLVSFNLSGPAGSVPGASRILMDIGVGAGGSEVVLIPDLIFTGESNGYEIMPYTTPVMPCLIPSSTRLSVRIRVSDTSIPTPDVCLYGVS